MRRFDEPELAALAAALADRYVLEAVVGQGTSAAVFLATDRRHDRRIALKVLRTTTDDAARAHRFHREIRTAARLQHPHILPLFDSGTAAGRLYYTMPFVEGGSLRDRLRREGRLSVATALRLARELAGALAHAHAEGVVHRDIKPENILLSGADHALLADFGIAAALEGGAVSLTGTGVAVGTPLYMSPEQARGEIVDGRTDVYALASVVYEMLTGSPPFAAPTPDAIMARRVAGPPPSARVTRPEVPASVDAALRKAMAPDPGDRFMTADALAAALESTRRPGWHRRLVPAGALAVAAGAATLGAVALHRATRARGPEEAAPPMLVVLPFKNLGPADDQYFADGLTEEITSRLAGLSGLRVISRTSADHFRNSTSSLRQIGSELGAQYVLEGSVRWERSAGGRGRIRVTPQLIRAADDSHLWADRYDADVTEALGIQGTIAEQVAAALDVALLEPERQGLAAGGTRDAEAYDFFLRGNEYFARGYGRAPLAAALELYHKAADRDPRFALALARLARAYVALHWFGYDKSPARLDDARRAADSALALAPDLPEARLALGYYYYWGHRDYARALEQFEAARRGQPSNSELLSSIARVERRRGRWETAAAGFAEAIRYDPRSHTRIFDLGDTYLSLRRYAEAEQLLDRAIALAPDWANPYVYKAVLHLAWRGDAARAGAVLQSAMSRLGAGALAPVLISYDLVSGTPFTTSPAFAAAVDGLNLSSFEGDSSRYYLLKTEAFRFRGARSLERAYADSARRVAEEWAREAPDDARHAADLALAYASLGRRDDAVRTARRALELLPPERDAATGPYLQIRLARVYAMLGEAEPALAALEPMLAVPCALSPAALAADPVWAPLRGHPRFQALIQPR